MTRLSDTQLVLLSNAAKRDDGALILPAKLAGDAADAAIRPLLARKFCKAVPKAGQLPLWKRGPAHEPLSLVITPKGLAAIGIDAVAGKDDKPSASTGRAVRDDGRERSPRRSERRIVPTRENRKIGKPRADIRQNPNSKIAKVVEMLRKPAGASIKALMSATGWQAHSVRGAISGAVKKNLGLKVTSEVGPKGRFYRIPK